MTITTDHEFNAAWAMHQCHEIMRLREHDDQMAEVIIPSLLTCCTVLRATEIIEDAVIEVADRIMADEPQWECPHCGRMNEATRGDCWGCGLESDEPDEGRCTSPEGHDWQVSDEDRTYCTNCGADGDA